VKIWKKSRKFSKNFKMHTSVHSDHLLIGSKCRDYRFLSSKNLCRYAINQPSLSVCWWLRGWPGRCAVLRCMPCRIRWLWEGPGRDARAPTRRRRGGGLKKANGLTLLSKSPFWSFPELFIRYS
jgi:hypothetical protein